MGRLRSNLTYANVMATVAVFIALGGTSYAATQLARNSVGSKQIRTGAVGASELRSSAVTSRDIRNGTISVRDMSSSTRRSLTGPPGPAGPAGPAGSATDYRAIISQGGNDMLGRHSAQGDGRGEYRIHFGDRPGAPFADISRCAIIATLAAVLDGAPGQEPEAGRITVGHVKDSLGSAALVRTYGADGTRKAQPFHITVSC